MIRRIDRLQAAWCLYDFANSAFATTILAVFFNDYFARVLAGGMEGTLILGRRIPGATLYTVVLSCGLLLVALLAPVVGVRADSSRRPILWLAALAAPGIVSTALLALPGPGDLAGASVLFMAAVMGFALSTVVYNGLLPRLGTPETMGRLSGWGWGLGYLGGALVLVLDRILLRGVRLPGDALVRLHLPMTFPVTALWWALFSLPLILSARRMRPAPAPPVRLRVAQLLGWIRRSPAAARFLLANLLFSDGLQTVVAMASIFAGTVLGWPPERLVVYFIAVQVAALAGSPVLGRWADRIGDRPVLLLCLGTWIAIAGATWQLGWSGRPALEYWLLGGLGGFILGPTQSLARSLLARDLPPQVAASILSLLAVSNRFAAILGPMTYGLVVWLTGDLRAAALSTAAFFAAGAILLAGLRREDLARELAALGRGT